MKNLTFTDFLKVLKSKLWVIALAIVLCAALSLVYCSFIATPMYSSSAIIAVTTGGISNDGDDDGRDSLTTAAVSTSMNMLPTYIGALRDGGLLYEMVEEGLEQRVAADATSVHYTAKELKSMVSWSYVEDELNVTLTVKSRVPEDAYIIAGEIAKTADSYLKVPYRYSAATVINYPTGASLSYPDTFLFTVVAAFAGAVAAIAVLYIYALTDTSVKSEEDLLKNGFTVLGSVPDLHANSKGGAYYRV